MNNDQGRMNFAAGIDHEKMRSDAAECRNIFKSIGDAAKREGEQMDNAMLKVGKTIGAAFAVSKIKDFTKDVISLRGEIQSLEISFQTLAGKTKGEALFKDIRQFAAQTPMMMKDLAQGAQTMLGFNIEAEKVMPILRAIGDISMGNAQKFNSLALAFSQMSATGKLMGQDLLQMINAGFNPLSVISEKTGKSIGELKEEMEQGKITTQMVTDAFIAATSEGGRFYQMLTKQAEGINGAQAQLSGAIDDMMNSIGQSMEGTTVELIHTTTELVQNYEQVGRVILGLIGTYGTYRVALMAVTAASGWASAAEAIHYNWLLLVERAQKMLNATMLKNPYVLVATLIAGVVAAMMSLSKTSKEVNAEQRILDDVTAKATASMAEEKARVEALSKIVHDNAKKLQERKNALGELQKIVPDYHASLTKEGDLINDNTTALERYIETLLRAAKIEALKGGLTDSFKELSNFAADVKSDRSDYGSFLNFFTSDKSIAQNKQRWSDWYDKFVNDPSKFMRKGQNGRTEVLMGEGIGAQWLNSEIDGISDQERNLIKAAEKYAEFSRLYQNILVEDITVSSSSKSSATPKKWGEEVAAHRKALSEAQAEVKRLQASATATTEEVKNAQQKVEAAEKKLKELGINVEKEGKAGNKAASVRQDNADMLASEAAERMKQSEEYARQLADQAKNDEFDIAQAKIDAMKDGFEKELMQNRLNYDRLEEQNKRRLREMLDAVAEERLRQMENENPTIFKKRDSNGKLEDDPGKRDEALRTIRLSLTVDDLSAEQKAKFEEFGRIAATSFETANRTAFEKMIGDVLTYEQQRTKIAEDYARKRNDLYEKNGDGTIKTDADGNKVFRTGVTQGNIEELNRQETEALNAIDEQFAQREETYKAWCEEIANLSLEQLESVLDTAQKKLEELEKTGSKDDKALAKARAKVNTAQKAVNNAKAKDNANPGKRTIKEWEDLYKTLNEVEKEFESIGDTVGGTVGEIVSQCGQMMTSTLSMINGIVQLTQMSATSIQGTALAGSTAISTMEKASVILTIISAALSIAMQIVSLFNTDKQKEKNIQRWQNQIEDLQDAYDTLGEKIDEVFSKNVSPLVERQNDMLEQQKALIRKQIATEREKKDSDSDRIRDWEKQLADLDKQIADNKKEAIDAIFGEDIKSAIEEFAEAYADAWASNEDRTKSARDTVKQMMRSMVTESIKAAIQSSGAMERIRKKLTEFYSDNVLSDWEQNYVMKMAADLQNELDRQFGWASGLLTDDESDREGSKKGIATASQDSVDELNGRATAIQSHTFSINENIKLLHSTTQDILQSVMHIEAETDGFGARMERVELRIKEMNDTLGDIATKGIRLKN